MAGMSKSDCDAFAGKIEVPSHRPFYTGIHVDSDLNVWVLPFPRLPSDSGLVAWLVFGADGKLRARAQLPARMRQPLIFSDHALTAVSDSLGVPYVVKLPIRKS
jgi:hypothetical protein